MITERRKDGQIQLLTEFDHLLQNFFSSFCRLIDASAVQLPCKVISKHGECDRRERDNLGVLLLTFTRQTVVALPS